MRTALKIRLQQFKETLDDLKLLLDHTNIDNPVRKKAIDKDIKDLYTILNKE